MARRILSTLSELCHFGLFMAALALCFTVAIAVGAF
jgi:hypothetical protein